MNPSVCDAIRSKRVIQFFYDGSLRTVEPHFHGISRAGREVLSGYQTSGHNHPDPSEGWMFYELNQMIGILITDECFDTRPDCMPIDRSMKRLHCRT